MIHCNCQHEGTTPWSDQKAKVVCGVGNANNRVTYLTILDIFHPSFFFFFFFLRDYKNLAVAGKQSSVVH
jgi:hypothetical protein